MTSTQHRDRRRPSRAAGLLLLTCLCMPGAWAGGMIQVRTLDGTPAMLAEFLEPGRWSVVMIWTTYCEICRGQFPQIRAFHERGQGRGAKVVGVALDGYAAVDRVTAHIAAHGLTFVNLVGELAEVAAGLEDETGAPFEGTPTYLLFDAHGALAGRVQGPVEPDDLDRFIAERAERPSTGSAKGPVEAR